MSAERKSHVVIRLSTGLIATRTITAAGGALILGTVLLLTSP